MSVSKMCRLLAAYPQRFVQLFKEILMQKSIHRFVSVPMLFAFLAAGAIFFTTPIIAAPTESRCNLTVNDGAKVLTTNQLSVVTSAAKKLEASALGSEVRVVTVSKDSNNLG